MLQHHFGTGYQYKFVYVNYMAYPVVTIIPQPVWNKTTISPSIPLKNVSKPEKIPQPGHAPCPEEIRFGFFVKALHGGILTFNSPVSH